MSVREVIAELLFFAGVAACAYGVWQWSQPAAFVLVGLVLAYFGWNMASPRLEPKGG